MLFNINYSQMKDLGVTITTSTPEKQKKYDTVSHHRLAG
jgi:hypothetical protein